MSIKHRANQLDTHSVTYHCSRNENGMSCKKCGSEHCDGDNQRAFDGLQVTVADEHDQTLVDARMLGVHSSAESRKLTHKSNSISTKRHSDFWLKRMMASFEKLGTFVRRHARAKTDMAAHALDKTPQRSNTS